MGTDTSLSSSCTASQIAAAGGVDLLGHGSPASASIHRIADDAEDPFAFLCQPGEPETVADTASQNPVDASTSVICDEIAASLEEKREQVQEWTKNAQLVSTSRVVSRHDDFLARFASKQSRFESTAFRRCIELQSAILRVGKRLRDWTAATLKTWRTSQNVLVSSRHLGTCTSSL